MFMKRGWNMHHTWAKPHTVPSRTEKRASPAENFRDWALSAGRRPGTGSGLGPSAGQRLGTGLGLTSVSPHRGLPSTSKSLKITSKLHSSTRNGLQYAQTHQVPQ